MRNLSSTLAVIVGIIFLAGGLLGFFDNPLLGSYGYFASTTAQNVFYLLTGIVALALGVADMHPMVSTGLQIIGGVYLLLGLAGFVSIGGTTDTFLGMNMADNWMHLVLGAGTLVSGFVKHQATSTHTPAHHGV